MQKFSTWLILSLAVVFWILRVVATYATGMGFDFIIKPIDMTTEIILLFTALVCFVLIAKRNFLGIALYLVAYWGYFGVTIWQTLNPTQTAEGTANIDYINLLFAFFGVVLPLLALFDWLFDKNKQAHPVDKKTDWFYKDAKYDIKKDERADTNNYKTL